MQGNKKQTDGHSDSSSIGSLLDDTDREVCSLTDRAFKSLCVAELEASFPEADAAASPSGLHGVSSKPHQGPLNHVLKKHPAFGTGLSKTYEQPTFQPFPKETQGDQKITTSDTPNIRRKLGLPVSGLRNYKHTSKVSSLIKTFDQFENQESSAPGKQPVRNSLAKFPLMCGGDMAFWGDKTILNIKKELSEFSDSYQNIANASGKHKKMPTSTKIDLVCQGPHSFYPPQPDASEIPKFNIFSVSKLVAKSRAGKGKEQGKKGSFLHSENSAFESWKLHAKKHTEVSGSNDFSPKEGTHKYMKETPFFKEPSVPEYKPPPRTVTTPVILEQYFSEVFPQKSQPQAKVSPLPLAHPHFLHKDIDAQVSLSPDLDLPASTYRIPPSPVLTPKASFPPSVTSQAAASPAPISGALIPLPPECENHGADFQPLASRDSRLMEKTLTSESEPEAENARPPWRRPKSKGRVEMAKDVLVTEGLKIKGSSLGKPPPAAADDSHISPSDPSGPPFNISKLLTPVIPSKTERVPSEGHILLVTPPTAEAEATKESEEKNPYCFQNNYKSKASSLLFNLKDIRKRVKSTYSPSPLLKILEDKKLKEPDSIKASVSVADTLVESNKYLGKPDEAHLKPSEHVDSSQEKDRDANLTEHLAGNYLTLKDHKMAPAIEFSTNGQNISQYSLPSSSYLASLTPEPEGQVQDFYLQDPKNKKVQNCAAEVSSQISPNLFQSAEENATNSERQPCPPSESKQKHKASSGSSSEESFVSILEPPFSESPFSLMQLFQKACLQESQKNRNEMNGEENPCSREKEKAEKKKGLQDSEVKDGRKEQSENESTGRETVMREKREVGLKSMDSAPEEKSEEPVAPTSPSSLKPNLFMIKDNTFKSSPVTKTVKIPLLRSLSCEDTISGGHGETEKQIYGPVQTTPDIHGSDLLLPRSQQNVKDSVPGRDAEGSGPAVAAGKAQRAAENVLGEGLRSSHAKRLEGSNKGVDAASMFSQKGVKNREKALEKGRENIITEKLRCSYASGPNFDSEEGFAESKQTFDAKEESSYFKSHPLSKRRGGACVKKIITRETNSPVALEATSPASSVAFQDTSSSLASSSLLSSRPESKMQPALISPSSETTASFNLPQASKALNPLSLPDVVGSADAPPATDAYDPKQPHPLSRDDGSSPATNEKLQLMGPMAKTAAKPPAVPPKTEKALRRAKKLADRRKKTEVQQKRLQEELPSPGRDSASLSVAQSQLPAVSPNSSSVSDLVRVNPTPPLSPTRSLPATRRKLLQDPDSGEYFIVDLPDQLKTFYDPESGRYVQISVPSSRRNVSQRPSSEMVPSSWALHPNVLPIRVSSVPTLASPSQLSESASVMQGAVLESASGWSQSGHYPDLVDVSHPYVEPAAPDTHTQEADFSHYNFETDVNLSDNADIISTGAIEDFAVEGIS